MKTTNDISKDIDITEEKAKLDYCCKKLLSFKVFLAHILKGCLDEFKDCEIDDIANKYIEGEPIVDEVAVHQDEKIKGMNTESTSVEEVTVRYDILFYAVVPKSKETVELIINVEVQNAFSPGYPLLKRAVYYCSRLISSQQHKGIKSENYKNLKKVFSIWVCTNAPVKKQNTITKFSFTPKSVVGNAMFNKSHYDLMEIVMVCLGGKEDDENYSGLIKLLDVLLSTKVKAPEKKKIIENEYGIKMTKTVESEVFGMCNISDGIYKKGMKQGIEQGIEQGKRQGLEQGIEVTNVNLLRKLISELNYTFEKAIEFVGISKSEEEKYRKLLLNNTY